MTRIAPLLLLAVVVISLEGCAARNRGSVVRTDNTAGEARRRMIEDGGPRLLRIGLINRTEAVTLTPDGDCLILAGTGRRRVDRLSAGESIRIEADGGALVWRAGRRTGRSGDHLFVQPVDPALTVTWQETPYPGELRVDIDAGTLTLVNVVELETYLRGVVPWEIGRPGAEGEAALAAQAVAARTYSIAHLGEREPLGFDMWAGVTDQVYRGLHGVDAHCDRAIVMTAGLVLRHQGREINASQPYLISHDDAERGGVPYCGGSSHATWTTDWSVGDLERILKVTLPEYLAWYESSPARQRWAGRIFAPARPGLDGKAPGRLLDLRIERRTTSGRMAALSIVTEAGVYTARGDRVRWILVPAEGRYSILKSAWFDLELRRDGSGALVRIAASGRGFGHGIGLCQSGALAMARLGHGYQRILSHYYPGASLERAWSE